MAAVELQSGASSAEVIDLGQMSAPALGVPAPARRHPADTGWVRAATGVDVATLGTATVLAELGASEAGVAATPVGWLIAFPLIVMAMLAARGWYRPRLTLRILDDLRLGVTAISIAAMVVLSVRVVATGDAAVAPQMVRLWAFGALLLVGGRATLALSEVWARRQTEALRNTLIVGAGTVGRLTANRLLAHPELGLRPVGFLDKNPRAAEEGSAVLPVLGASWDLEEAIQRHDVRQVIVTFSQAPHDVLIRLMRRCDELGVSVAFVPRLFDRMTEKLTVDYIGGLPLLSTVPARPKSWQFAVKHAVDRLLAALALIVLLPVLAAAAIATRLSLGRPILFRQTRVGRDGRHFQMLKFRSMSTATREGAELQLAPDTAPGGVEGEDTRTPVGDLLRRTSLDELPQLVNVLRGEMSLIGPRPERPEFVGRFEGTVRRYEDRHRVKAGITGWAQVNGSRGKTSISERAEWDNYYIENWSLWLDAKIVLKTVAAVLTSFRNIE